MDQKEINRMPSGVHMTTDTKRARELAEIYEAGEDHDEIPIVLCALADEVERLQDSRDADRTAQRYQTDGVSDMTSYEDYSAARSRWFHERDTIWKPLLEAAEKYAYLDPLGTAELQDAIHAAREAMGEEK